MTAEQKKRLEWLERAILERNAEVNAYRRLTDKQAEMIRKLEDEARDFRFSKRVRFWRDRCVDLTIANLKLTRENLEMKFGQRGKS